MDPDVGRTARGPPAVVTAICWVAVEELNLSYHNMDIYQIIWFLDHGNLI